MGEKKEKKYGRIEFIMGPMYGGKSTELKRRIRRMVSAKKRCLIVKFDKDNRYQVTDDLRSSDHLLVTHDKESVPAMPAHDLAEVDRILEGMPPFDCIGIDEILDAIVERFGPEPYWDRPAGNASVSSEDQVVAP